MLNNKFKDIEAFFNQNNCQAALFVPSYIKQMRDFKFNLIMSNLQGERRPLFKRFSATFLKKENSAFNLEVANRPSTTVVFIMSGQTGCDLFFFYGDVWVGSDGEQACGRLLMFALAVVCISASGMEAQARAPMAARTLAGRTTQTSSRD